MADTPAEIASRIAEQDLLLEHEIEELFKKLVKAKPKEEREAYKQELLGKMAALEGTHYDPKQGFLDLLREEEAGIERAEVKSIAELAGELQDAAFSEGEPISATEAVRRAMGKKAACHLHPTTRRRATLNSPRG